MIKRDVFPSLLAHLQEREITIITGPRQVGNTYLMRLLEENRETEGRSTLYFNLDIEDDRQFFASQGSLMARVRLELGDSPGVIFIDEIQRKTDAGLFLKGLYDMNLPYKFVVSGSGSLELKEKIQESLAGRKRVFTVDPINLHEFVNFKTGYKYEEKLQDFIMVEKNLAERLLEEDFVFGGYPRVITAETADRKTEEIKDIYQSYVEKDIKGLLDVGKPQAFTDLLKILASQIGSLVNVAELSSTIGISVKTINSYIWYLERTYIISRVTPFYLNVRKEVTKAPVFYFFDPGLRNYLLGLFALPSLPAVLSGHLFENVVYNILKQTVNPPTTINFWRTRDNAEVDFVLRTGLATLPIEVKYKHIEKVQVSRSFRSFLVSYRPKKAYLAHLGETLTEKVGDTDLTLLPYYLLPTISHTPGV